MFAHLSRLSSRCLHPRTTPFCLARSLRHSSNQTNPVVEKTNVEHSKFIAEASSGQAWKSKSTAHAGAAQATREDFDKVTPGKGKLSPTSSHLFKLILPLGLLSSNPKTAPKDAPPTVILLHPSQPLSHVSRLILASLAPETPNITFRNAASTGQAYQWSDSTDVGDFIRDAARAAQFSIHVSNPNDSKDEKSVDVEVPTFADRTRFLRRRLNHINTELKDMEGLKAQCDAEAHRNAKRLAMSGFGLLVAYWVTVCRLTFFDLGWEVMEPITYLSGLSTVICGYLWFLYQGREVSYSSVLDRSISKRREALYVARGLDIDLWMDHVAEAKSLRKEITRIAEDYDQDRHRDKDDKDDPRGQQGPKKSDKETKENKELDEHLKQVRREADMEKRKKELDKDDD